eukprot:gene5406-962_t
MDNEPSPLHMDKSSLCVETDDGKDTYSFEKCFISTKSQGGQHPAGTQTEVLEPIASKVLDGAWAGLNSCAIAYGQSGTGKSYSIMGDLSDREQFGLAPKILEGLFNKTQGSIEYGSVFKVEISVIEILESGGVGVVYDLIPEKKKQCGIRGNPQDGFVVPSAQRQEVQSADQAIGILRAVQDRRKGKKFGVNEMSSRAHVVCEIHIRKTSDAKGGAGPEYASVKLADLAGSEHTRKSATGKAGTNANKSLVALSSCVDSVTRTQGVSKIPPYRDSILTQVLCHGIGGNSNTYLLVTTSPSPKDVLHTTSALSFAAKFGRVTNFPFANGNRLAQRQEKLSSAQACNKSALESVQEVHQMQESILTIEVNLLDTENSLARNQIEQNGINKQLSASNEECNSIEKTRLEKKVDNLLSEETALMAKIVNLQKEHRAEVLRQDKILKDKPDASQDAQCWKQDIENLQGEVSALQKECEGLVRERDQSKKLAQDRESGLKDDAIQALERMSLKHQQEHKAGLDAVRSDLSAEYVLEREKLQAQLEDARSSREAMLSDQQVRHEAEIDAIRKGIREDTQQEMDRLGEEARSLAMQLEGAALNHQESLAEERSRAAAEKEALQVKITTEMNESFDKMRALKDTEISSLAEQLTTEHDRLLRLQEETAEARYKLVADQEALAASLGLSISDKELVFKGETSKLHAAVKSLQDDLERQKQQLHEQFEDDLRQKIALVREEEEENMLRAQLEWDQVLGEKERSWEKQLTTWEGQLKVVHEQLQEANNTVNAQEVTIQDLKTQLEAQALLSKEQEQTWNEARDQLIQHHDEHISTMSEEHSTVVQELEIKGQEKENKITTNLKDISHLQEQIESITSQLKIEVSQKLALEEQVSSLQEQAEVEAKQHLELQQESKTKICEMKSEITAEKERGHQQLEDVKIQLEQQICCLEKSKVQEQEQMVQQHESQVQKLQKEKSTFTTKHKKMIEELQITVQTTHQELDRKNTQIEEDMKKGQKQVQKLQEQHAHEISKQKCTYSDQIESLKHEITLVKETASKAYDSLKERLTREKQEATSRINREHDAGLSRMQQDKADQEALWAQERERSSQERQQEMQRAEHRQEVWRQEKDKVHEQALWQWKEEKTSLQESLSVANSELERWQGKLQEKKQQHEADLAQSKAESDYEKASLVKELEAMRQEDKSNRDRAEAEVHQMRERMSKEKHQAMENIKKEHLAAVQRLESEYTIMHEEKIREREQLSAERLSEIQRMDREKDQLRQERDKERERAEIQLSQQKQLLQTEQDQTLSIIREQHTAELTMERRLRESACAENEHLKEENEKNSNTHYLQTVEMEQDYNERVAQLEHELSETKKELQEALQEAEHFSSQANNLETMLHENFDREEKERVSREHNDMINGMGSLSKIRQMEETVKQLKEEQQRAVDKKTQERKKWESRMKEIKSMTEKENIAVTVFGRSRLGSNVPARRFAATMDMNSLNKEAPSKPYLSTPDSHCGYTTPPPQKSLMVSPVCQPSSPDPMMSPTVLAPLM